MTTGPSASTTRRRWTLAAAVATALYVLGLVFFGVAVARPEWVRELGLGAYANSRKFWPILVQVLLGMAAFVCYYRPRRRENRSPTVLVSGVLAVTTMVLGFVSYLHCPEADEQSTIWAPLTWSLNLVGGNVSSCGPGAYPLALQLARLSGPLLLVIAALGIAAAVSRNQYDRIRVRYARSLVLLVGLDEDAVPLLRRLAADRERGITLAVFVTDPAAPLVRAARDRGARVVAVDPTSSDNLRSLLTSRGRFKVLAVYAASDETAVNLRWAERLRSVADASKRSRFDLPPRMVVRIDDPWQAEYWRRTNSYRTEGKTQSVQWMSDALSVYEVTAALLLDRILVGGPRDPTGPAFDRLVLVGHSPLALAVCADLAQREREGVALEERLPLGFGDVLLIGPQAEVLREQHRLRQARFGNEVDLASIAVDTDEPTSAHLRSALGAARHPAVILADDPSLVGPGRATYLAALHPEWTFFSWSQHVRGVPEEPIMERLFLLGLTTEAPLTLPVDSWERAARVVHEQFRLELRRAGTLDPEKPSHRPWDRGLDPFFKKSNIRQVTTVLAAAEGLGRSWGPIQRGVSAEGLVATTSIPPADLDSMAQTEHASWMRYLTDHGWRYGPVRDDGHQVHPSLVGWDQLPDSDREKTRDGVAGALAVLAGLGYRSTTLRQVHSAPSPTWSTVARRGEVTAHPTSEEWTWTNDNGDRMQARAGDWQVTDDSGRSWSVAADVFESTYGHLRGDRWRRTGRVRARPAVPGEVVVSLEGEQTARDGDWVVEGARGEQWLTSASHFAANYRRGGGSDG